MIINERFNEKFSHLDKPKNNKIKKIITKVCNIDRNIYDAVVSKSKYSQLRSPR